MSVVDDVRKVYEERDKYQRAYEELKQNCRRKMEEATTKLVLADEENKRLKHEVKMLRDAIERGIPLEEYAHL